jgi:Tol biopolymer transport system component
MVKSPCRRTDMSDVFLSYSRTDLAVARCFAEGLQREGFSVWWDQSLNAGETFDQATERALKEARVVVVLWSKRSAQSRWVRSEATLADRYGTLVPAMIEPCERPIMFELTHTADLTGWNGDSGDARWRSFVVGLRHSVDKDVMPAAAPIVADARQGRGKRRPWLWAVAGMAPLAAVAGWLMFGRTDARPAVASALTSTRQSTATIGQDFANLPDALQGLASGEQREAGIYLLTDFEGIEEHAAISPDGKLVAFVSDRDGPFDVWISRIGSDEFTNLTHGRFPQLHVPAVRVLGFSPDGSHVEFWVQDRAASGAGGVVQSWSLPVVGGATRTLQGAVAEFAWSPDRKKLVYHAVGAGDAMFVREVGKAADRELFKGADGEHNHYPIWSPDGEHVYFMHGQVPDGLELWRIASVGDKPERLTSRPALMSYPVFLNATTLAYLAEDIKGVGQTLHLLDTSTGVTRSIQAGLDRYSSLAASADGRRLVATVTRQPPSLWSVPVSSIAQADAAAERIRVATRGGYSPRAGLDDLVYLSPSADGMGIWRMEGTTPTEIWGATRGAVAGAPALDPKSRRIAFPVRVGSATRLYVGNVDGTEMRELAGELDVRGTPAWSPDGRWIAVAAESGAGPRLYKIPAEEGPPVQLTKHYARDPVWSPAGGFLVYVGEQVGPTHALGAVTIGGDVHPIPVINLNSGWTRVAFLPGTDAAARLVVPKGDAARRNLWLVDLESGKQRQLTDFDAGYQLGDFDISADGREIVFDRVRQESDVVMIDLGSREL